MLNVLFKDFRIAKRINAICHYFRESEKQAQQKLIDYITRNQSSITNNSTLNHTTNYEYSNGYQSSDGGYIDTSTINHDHSTMNSTVNHTTLDHTINHATFITQDADLSQLSLEIEKESTGFIEKSRHLQEQLEALRHEIDELKVDDNMTPMDNLHKEQLEQGNTKYSTIQKVKRGTTHSRVTIFEQL